MVGDEFVTQALLGVLNLGLAMLVLGRGRGTLASRLAGGLFGLNAFGILWGRPEVVERVVPLGLPAIYAYEIVRNASVVLTLVPLALLPFAFPRRRFATRTFVLVGAFMAVVLLAPSVLRALQVPLAGPWNSFLFWPIYFAAPAVGAIVLLDSYVRAPNPFQRTQTSYFLAAYWLKLLFDTTASTYTISTSGFGFTPADAVQAGLILSWHLAAYITPIACFAVPVTLIATQVLARLRGDPPRPWQTEILILLVPLAVMPLVRATSVFHPEYLLVRPILLTHGILAYNLLDLDLRRSSAVLAIVALSATAATYIAATTATAELGYVGPLGDALSLALTLAALGAIAWPIARLGLASPSEIDARRLVLYRAALERVASEGRAATASEELRDLRRELGVTDREHEILVSTPGAPNGSSIPVAGATRARVGRYVLEREIGRGGSGEVFLARDERLGREVAVKRLAGDRRRDAAAVARFEKEIRLASSLQHPNIVSVYDMEFVGDDAYLVMEYVAGGTLETRVRSSGPLSEPEALAVALDIARALAALHAQGIVHRDVKPSNILLSHERPHGRAKLADFTIAREVVSGDTVSVGGAPLGTISYMSPEQARGHAATPASDVYALGATLHYALTGRPPLEIDGLTDLEARIRISREAPRLPLAGAKPATNAWLARALAHAPGERYHDAGEALAALEAATRPPGAAA